jgi:hypothetical protein
MAPRRNSFVTLSTVITAMASGLQEELLAPGSKARGGRDGSQDGKDLPSNGGASDLTRG